MTFVQPSRSISAIVWYRMSFARIHSKPDGPGQLPRNPTWMKFLPRM